MTVARRLAFLMLLFAAALCAGPFEFHSDFWLNLHHFLYEQALHPDQTLTGDEKLAWNKAVQFYRQSIIRHDLMEDANMRSIDTELAEDETLPKLIVNGQNAVTNNLTNRFKFYRLKK